ncbi:radical SAM family heme chaperone HemW [Elioraea rosea]|uniref:radical SAM family heme chaperone HemW n=1 Tax=Elioraea rosea TaxID=2492390 RepID=UPI00118403B6|nr:radical SAM family heme chaperone HemW [Elioraea rosea]
MSNPSPEPVALYVHWPFCLARCPYCDFNAHVRERLDEPRYRSAILAELAFEAARIGPRPLGSLFFGGGTPSLMSPDTVGAIIAAAKAAFPGAEEPEITLEANPTSVELGRLAGFRDAGVNRISLGIQALDDTALAFLGRKHTAEQALAALAQARSLFRRASFDLIYARPGQSVTAWRDEVRRALGFGLDHLSLYQLTIEPGTPFERAHARGEIALPDEAEQAALYAATVEEAAKAGLSPYEVSNYARPGDESRHNLAYWSYADYAGIGPGAHGRIPLAGVPTATVRIRAPEAWMEAVERRGHGVREEEALPPEARAREMLLMGLRLTRGIDPARFAARAGMPLEDALEPRALAQAIGEGWLAWTRHGALAATAAGRLRLDALLPVLVR